MKMNKYSIAALVFLGSVILALAFHTPVMLAINLLDLTFFL